MYDTDEEFDNDNMEVLEISSTDEEKYTTNNKNNKRSKGIPKKKRSASKSQVRNIKKPQTRLSKKQLWRKFIVKLNHVIVMTIHNTSVVPHYVHPL